MQVRCIHFIVLPVVELTVSIKIGDQRLRRLRLIFNVQETAYPFFVSVNFKQLVFSRPYGRAYATVLRLSVCRLYGM